MASLTTFGNLKKLTSGGGNDSSNGEKDKTPFSALLRQKREEDAAKKAATEAATKGGVSEKAPESGKVSPPATTPKPVNPLRTATSVDIVRESSTVLDGSSTKGNLTDGRITSDIKTQSSVDKKKTDLKQDLLRNTATKGTLSNGEVHDKPQEGSSSKVAAPAFVKKMVDCEVFEGDCARFDCKITGDPEPEVTWLQDGLKVEESRRFIVDYYDDGACSLIVKNCIEDDDAEYTFKASNSAGEISCTAELIVDVL